MNKLVSKNPVQRFKQGKQIVKAYGGVKIFGAEMGPKSSRIVRAAKPYIASVVPFARYFGIQGSANALIDGLTYIENSRQQLRNQQNTSTVKPNTRTNTRTNTNNSKKRVSAKIKYGPANLIGDITFLKWNENPYTGQLVSGLYVLDGDKYWLGSDNTVTPIRPVEQPAQQPVQQQRRPVVRRPPTYYATRAYRGRSLPEGLNSRAAVMEYQKKLNKLGANITPDGIWGDKTQAAYEQYGRFNPEYDDDKVQAQILGSKPTTTMVDIASINPSIITTVPTNSTVPMNSWIAKANSLNNLHYTINPIFAKQGTKLISRNLVERFQQGRKLPTAPKAEDRYRNSRRDSIAYFTLTPDELGRSIKRITTPSNAKIQREIIFNRGAKDNDTIYTEVPEHTKRLPFFPPVNIIPRRGFSYAKTPEYEILKRRFNTAWSLAK